MPESLNQRSELSRSFDAVNETVIALFDAEGRFRCSAVWVGDRILTAHHCKYDDSQDLSYSTYSFYSESLGVWTNFFTATIVAENKEQDVMLLEPNGDLPYHRNAMVSPRDPSRGEIIYPFGHPWGIGYYFSEGRVVAPHKVGALEPNMNWMLHNGPIFPGMSGGPVYNVEGDVLGVNSFIYNGEENLAGAVHTQSIRDIFK